MILLPIVSSHSPDCVALGLGAGHGASRIVVGCGSTTRKVIFSLFILVFAVPAWADEQQDQFDRKNVYDAFGELKLSPSMGVTLEEDVTSRIKRYMANLLYPVDLTSFVRPEKDVKLRELIVALQKQMGEVATGVLTYGQFSKLQDAARSVDEKPVAVAPGTRT